MIIVFALTSLLFSVSHAKLNPYNPNIAYNESQLVDTKALGI